MTAGPEVRRLLVEAGAPANGLARDVEQSGLKGGKRVKGQTNNVGLMHANDARSTIARLKRDRPDLAERP